MRKKINIIMSLLLAFSLVSCQEETSEKDVQTEPDVKKELTITGKTEIDSNEYHVLGINSGEVWSYERKTVMTYYIKKAEPELEKYEDCKWRDTSGQWDILNLDGISYIYSIKSTGDRVYFFCREEPEDDINEFYSNPNDEKSEDPEYCIKITDGDFNEIKTVRLGHLQRSLWYENEQGLMTMSDMAEFSANNKGQFCINDPLSETLSLYSPDGEPEYVLSYEQLSEAGIDAGIMFIDDSGKLYTYTDYDEWMPDDERPYTLTGFSPDLKDIQRFECDLFGNSTYILGFDTAGNLVLNCCDAPPSEGAVYKLNLNNGEYEKKGELFYPMELRCTDEDKNFIYAISGSDSSYTLFDAETGKSMYTGKFYCLNRHFFHQGSVWSMYEEKEKNLRVYSHSTESAQKQLCYDGNSGMGDDILLSADGVMTFEKDNTADEDIYKENLIRFSEGGSVSEYHPAGTPEFFDNFSSVKKMHPFQDGSYAAFYKRSADSGLEYWDTEGKRTAGFISDSDMFIEDVGWNANEETFLYYYIDEDFYISQADPETETVSEKKIKIPAYVSTLMNGSGKYDLFYYWQEGLYGVDAENQKTDMILDYSRFSEISGPDIRGVKYHDDDSFEVIAGNMIYRFEYR